jgi:hypothetical protein
MGGGAGGYIDAIIMSPSSSYVYSVGAGGAGQSGSVHNGGAGAGGIIIIDEFYSTTNVSASLLTSSPVTVAASYWASANTTSNSTTPFNFDSKEYDTHNAVTTGSNWKYTCQVAGLYRVTFFINGAASVNPASFNIYKNGNPYKTIAYSPNPASNTVDGAAPVRLAVGDYIDLRVGISSTAATGGASLATLMVSWIAIEKIGD